MIKNSFGFIIFFMFVCFFYWKSLNGDDLSNNVYVHVFFVKILSFFILLFLSIGSIFAFVKDDIASIVFSSISSIFISLGVLFNIKYSYMSCIVGTMVLLILYFVADKDIIKRYFSREVTKAMVNFRISRPGMAFLGMQVIVMLISFS